MKQLIVGLKRKPGMSMEEFRDYYETSHAPLAVKHMGHLIKDYRRNYAQDRLTPVPLDQDGEGFDGYFDAVSVISFANQEDMEEFFRIATSPGLTELFVADEANFLDRDMQRFQIADQMREVRSADGTILWSPDSAMA